MSATTDAFARFLEVLSDSLDDHHASAGSLASRAHLSRYHFDRLVSAAAGEPPAALRRRILLERAAYRLITTDDDVIRVALEAGYASNEAFTRAFRRAYGRPPARWRRRPTDFRLAAPSHAQGIDHEPTLRSLLARLVGQLAMWHAAVHDRPYDFDAEQDETIGHLRAKLAAVGPAFLSDVRSIIEEGRLDETFVDAACDPPEVFTNGGMIAHVLTFAAHRRTLVCGALAGAGVTELGAGDPMHWVAEHAA